MDRKRIDAQEHLVFVFGTLKEGFPNFHVNRGARLPGNFITVHSFPLYLVGERCSPWLIDAPGRGHCVAGQVFRVDGAALALMDELERVGEPNGYVRVAIDVVSKEDAARETLQVFAYLKPAAQFAPEEARHGPLAEYSMEHAALYRARR